jgi:hypothetical protein
MSDQGRPRPARMSAYATASSHLARPSPVVTTPNGPIGTAAIDVAAADTTGPSCVAVVHPGRT